MTMCERVCCATAFSVSLEKNWKLLSGRKFSLIRSRSAFFSFGLTSAPFHSEGNFPSFNDRLIVRVVTGSSSSKQSFSRLVGIGSLKQDLVGASIMSLLTDSGVIRVKLVICTGVTLFATVLHFLHWCYTCTVLLLANQNRVFSCVLLRLVIQLNRSLSENSSCKQFQVREYQE